METRGERRDRKKLSRQKKLRKSGMSVFLLQRIIWEKAEKAKKRLEELPPLRPLVELVV